MKKAILTLAVLCGIGFGAAAQSVDTTKVRTADTSVAGVRIINVDLNANWRLNNLSDTVAIKELPKHGSWPRDPQMEIQPILPGTPANIGEGYEDHKLYEEKKSDMPKAEPTR